MVPEKIMQVIILLTLILIVMLIVKVTRRKGYMIKVYGEDKEKTVLKCLDWMGAHHLPCERLTNSNVDKEVVVDILKLSEGGFDDCVKSGYRAALNNFSFTEALNFIVENPNLLREPIIWNENKLVIGFQIDELTTFLPRGQRGQGI